MGKYVASVTIVTLAIVLFAAVAMADDSTNSRFSSTSQVSVADFPTCVAACTATGTECAVSCASSGAGPQLTLCVFNCGFTVLTCFVQCAGAGPAPAPPSRN